jgi:glucokinase
MILAGDIGGTNTRLAVVNMEHGRLRLKAKEIFPSREQPSLESALRKFIAHHPLPFEFVALGVAGFIRHGRSEAPNLPWIVDARSLARELQKEQVGLINDLEACAYGLAELGPKDFVVLNEGEAGAAGNAGLLAAGTGLGEAGLYWDRERFHPFASEGGHVDFAPRNHLEMELLDYLLKRYSRVSVERVVSGPGLYNIYQFLRDSGRGEETPVLAEEIRRSDPPAIITRKALEGEDPLCLDALSLFVACYGAEAGNLAMKLLATGGIYLGGGIAPKILRRLRQPDFMNAFTSKGRLSPLLKQIPVRIIHNPDTALLGAARYALKSAVTGQPRV